ncbi:MAG: serine kinase [Erythrobacter sp.]|uniref:HPr kinase/phosphorylase n=1 Tax=Erythrobacter sp. TaxID=1042 RepID=UPI00261C8C5B|nr:serine kinase [Erythrobacter sp.]MDJ0976940.1 serine kinase [Erythrobacter sp.]
MTSASCIVQGSAVSLEGRALLIEGAPGSGKSSLALALIESGAKLIGDDGVTLTREEIDAAARLVASAPPNIAGLIEARGVGLARLPVAEPAPLALILALGEASERLPERAESREILGCLVPVLAFEPGAIAPAMRARLALRIHGLPSI